jgi:hypothetical protein
MVVISTRISASSSATNQITHASEWLGFDLASRRVVRAAVSGRQPRVFALMFG